MQLQLLVPGIISIGSTLTLYLLTPLDWPLVVSGAAFLFFIFFGMFTAVFDRR